MCRSIVTLRGADAVSDEDVRAAALQFVRKISGYRSPSQANRAVFERAVDDIAQSTRSLLDELVTNIPAAARSARSAAPGRQAAPVRSSRRTG
jgi:hypothetical protein